jgi:hypothetical protein
MQAIRITFQLSNFVSLRKKADLSGRRGCPLLHHVSAGEEKLPWIEPRLLCSPFRAERKRG